MSKYINPYTDFGFKKLFGEEGSKEVLMDFLNQLLPPIHQIVSLTLKNPERLPDAAKERKAFFDIECISIKGEAFIVEMQKAKVKYFKDRALFYTTFPIREQAKKGADWNFELKPIYFIAILDFFYDENEEKAKFFRDVKLTDQYNEAFYEKLQFKFLQMPAFTKEAHELETRFDKWAYFIKNLETFKDIPQILNEPVFEYAFETARISNFNSKQRAAYEKSRLDYLSVKAVAETAREEALLEGIVIGEERGIVIGEERGIVKGRELRDKELILKLYADGKKLSDIGTFLDIPLMQVEQIIQSLKHKKE